MVSALWCQVMQIVHCFDLHAFLCMQLLSVGSFSSRYDMEDISQGPLPSISVRQIFLLSKLRHDFYRVSYILCVSVWGFGA
jgi:hypothetical protein